MRSLLRILVLGPLAAVAVVNLLGLVGLDLVKHQGTCLLIAAATGYAVASLDKYLFPQ